VVFDGEMGNTAQSGQFLRRRDSPALGSFAPASALVSQLNNILTVVVTGIGRIRVSAPTG